MVLAVMAILISFRAIWLPAGKNERQLGISHNPWAKLVIVRKPVVKRSRITAIVHKWTIIVIKTVMDDLFQSDILETLWSKTRRIFWSPTHWKMPLNVVPQEYLCSGIRFNFQYQFLKIQQLLSSFNFLSIVLFANKNVWCRLSKIVIKF